MATLRSPLKAPGKTCRFCEHPLDRPVAVWTGDGWYLCWSCDEECDEGEPFEDWPFVEEAVRAKDLEAAGFTVV